MFFRLILSRLLDKNQYICTDNPNLYHYGRNKIRTIANGYCPLSFRSVDSIYYKKPCLYSMSKIIYMPSSKSSFNSTVLL